MVIVGWFKDLFESIPHYRKIVFLMFLIKNDVDLLTECGYLKNDNNRLWLEFKKILLEQNEDYLEYIRKEEETNIERIFRKKMENDNNRLSIEFDGTKWRLSWRYKRFQNK